MTVTAVRAEPEKPKLQALAPWVLPTRHTAGTPRLARETKQRSADTAAPEGPKVTPLGCGPRP